MDKEDVVHISSVQLLCSVWLSANPWTAAHQASLSITNSQSLLKFRSIKSVMPSTISSSVVPFACLQSFPASGSFQISQFFTSGGQSIGVSASAPVLPTNIQDWFPLGWLICTHIWNLISSMNPLTWTRSREGVISMNIFNYDTYNTVF